MVKDDAARLRGRKRRRDGRRLRSRDDFGTSLFRPNEGVKGHLFRAAAFLSGQEYPGDGSGV
jgi:hypothetical protein